MRKFFEKLRRRIAFSFDKDIFVIIPTLAVITEEGVIFGFSWLNISVSFIIKQQSVKNAKKAYTESK